MRLFISAGEASGDAYGAALAFAVAQDGLTIEAIGGPKLRAAGAKIVADSSTWGAIGIVKALTVAPRVYRGGLRAKHRILQGTPGVLVVIDFGYLNIKLARIAKRAGWKVLYFIPPGSWRRDRQGKDLPEITDAIVTPFSWSAEILDKMGANAHWYGHPIKSLGVGRSEQRSETGIGILPGSRGHEIQHNLPHIADAVKGLPTAEFAVAVTVDADELRRKWIDLTGRTDDKFTLDDVPGVLARARAAIVCSGTATLQAAVARCPMVVVYRITKLMGLESVVFGLRKKIKFISLPNILLDRKVVPELVQEDANGQAIRARLEELLRDGDERSAQLRAFEEIDEVLGPDDCIARTAKLIVTMLTRQ